MPSADRSPSTRRRILLVSGALVGLLGGSGVPAEEPKVLRFATYATERPSEELRKMEPFQKDLERALHERGLPYQIEIRIFPTYDEGIAAMAQGEIDFARLGPVSYVVAKQKNPSLNLLVVEGHEGKKNFSGLIIVAKASPIQTLADLRGKRFAFGDPTSTTGRFLAQAELVKAGLTAVDLVDYEYLGRHDKVVFAVAAGTYDAGATNEGTFAKYATGRNLRVLTRFASPTQAWVARGDLDPATIRILRTSLLDIKGTGLEYIDRNTFLPGTDADYDELRRIIKAARGFGG